MIVAWIFVLSCVCSVSAKPKQSLYQLDDNCKSEIGIEPDEYDAKAYADGYDPYRYDTDEYDTDEYDTDEVRPEEKHKQRCHLSKLHVKCLTTHLQEYPNIAHTIMFVKKKASKCWPAKPKPSHVYRECLAATRRHYGHYLPGCEEMRYIVDCMTTNLQYTVDRFTSAGSTLQDEIKGWKDYRSECWPKQSLPKLAELDYNCMRKIGYPEPDEYDTEEKYNAVERCIIKHCDLSKKHVKCLTTHLQEYPNIAHTIMFVKKETSECWPAKPEPSDVYRECLAATWKQYGRDLPGCEELRYTVDCMTSKLRYTVDFATCYAREGHKTLTCGNVDCITPTLQDDIKGWKDYGSECWP